ncbi:MAG: hypothetical protein QNJ40_20785 [Xanthomonadales bacterium]|nr:hypothetical protein [Xanthomonadales bacterium]
MIRKIWLSCALALLVLLPGGAGLAQEVPEFPRDDNYLLLEYSRYSLKLAERDPTPLLRIYGSGRAVIYHPAYTSRAGVYEINLDESELAGIISRVVQAQLHEADSVGLVEAAEEAAISQEQQTGELFYSSDQTISELQVFVSSGGKTPLLMENLQTTDRRFPGLVQVGSFASLERDLLALAHGNIGAVKRAPLSMQTLRGQQ